MVRTPKAKALRKSSRPARIAYRFFTRNSLGQLCAEADTSFLWPEPKNGEPGDWRHHDGPVEICAKGFHAALTVEAALRHRQGFVFGKVQIGTVHEEREEGKIVTRKMRVLELYAGYHLVGLAAMAALDSISNYESWKPGDTCLRDCVKACIDVIRNGSSAAESAARSAESAAESAAASAAWSARSAAASAASAAARQRLNEHAERLLSAGNREYVAQYVEAHLKALPAAGEAVAK